MLDGYDLDYEAAVHLNTPLTEAFYPDWDGPDEDDSEMEDDLWEARWEAEVEAEDPKRIFDALCDAGIM